MKARSQSFSIPKKRSKPRGGKPNCTEDWTVRRAIAELQLHGQNQYLNGMAHFGIRARKSYGVSTPKLHQIARKIGKNHALGLQLWNAGIHDAKHLGAMISEPQSVTAAQMERWVKQFYSWDICDGTCCHLFAHAEPAWRKAREWCSRKKEFEKRAGFALAAYLAVHDKQASDAEFRSILNAIEREAWDERNFVKKAVNWALRNIGKRNRTLNREAIAVAEKIRRQGTKAGRWIAADALRELRSEAVQKRLLKKGN
jgi:3-methyladenine DNA glycosylase AlkD